MLDGNPDLYGPFWIATTVVVILFLTGTISQYLAREGKTHFAYDFTLLSGAAGLIYGYTFVIPVALWGALRWFKSESANLLECVTLYGYANLTWYVFFLLSSPRLLPDYKQTIWLVGWLAASDLVWVRWTSANNAIQDRRGTHLVVPDYNHELGLLRRGTRLLALLPGSQSVRLLLFVLHVTHILPHTLYPTHVQYIDSAAATPSSTQLMSRPPRSYSWSSSRCMLGSPSQSRFSSSRMVALLQRRVQSLPLTDRKLRGFKIAKRWTVSYHELAARWFL